ncbi:MAG: hypothetical protein AAF198_05135 [Pseudomonadota bacterium]
MNGLFFKGSLAFVLLSFGTFAFSAPTSWQVTVEPGEATISVNGSAPRPYRPISAWISSNSHGLLKADLLVFCFLNNQPEIRYRYKSFQPPHTVTFLIDGISFNLQGERRTFPANRDTYQFGTTAPDFLITALKSGREVTLKVDNVELFTLPLKGSSSAISQALNGCGNSGSSGTFILKSQNTVTTFAVQ